MKTRPWIPRSFSARSRPPLASALNPRSFRPPMSVTSATLTSEPLLPLSPLPPQPAASAARTTIAAQATRRRVRGIPAVYPGLGLPKRSMGGHEARPSIEPLLLSPYLTVLGGLTLPEARSFCHLPSTLISAVRRGAVVETLPTPTPPFLAL